MEQKGPCMNKTWQNILIGLAVLAYVVAMIYFTNPGSDYASLVQTNMEEAMGDVIVENSDGMTFEQIKEAAVVEAAFTLESPNELTGDDLDNYKKDWAQKSMTGLSVGAGILSAGYVLKAVLGDRANMKKWGGNLLRGLLVWLVIAVVIGIMAHTGVSYTSAKFLWIGSLAVMSGYAITKVFFMPFCGRLYTKDGKAQAGQTANRCSKLLAGFVNVMELRNPFDSNSAKKSEGSAHENDLKDKNDVQKAMIASLNDKIKRLEDAQKPALAAAVDPTIGEDGPAAIIRRRLPAMDTILSSIKF